MEGILLSKKFIEPSLAKLDSFFEHVLLPEILTWKLEISEMEHENSEHPCKGNSRNSNSFADMQIRKKKKNLGSSGNAKKWVKTLVGIFENC